jgi:hypothetical protein
VSIGICADLLALNDRDLKLENILLDKNENVKLVDFGFTRHYDPRKLLETWCGTYSYSAPEILRGQKYSGEGSRTVLFMLTGIAVDVWSLGVILYTLLTGQLPFDGEDEMATKLRVTKREYKMPDDISAGICSRCCRPLIKVASSLISSILAEQEDRPTLAKILDHPFLTHQAPRQLHILAHNMLVPFSTPIEKRLLDRFEKANIDTHRIMQQVAEGGTGPLVGLWELSLEKALRHEEHKKRKKKRRQSHEISLISTTEYVDDDEVMVSPRAMTPTTPEDTRFTESGFAVAMPSPLQEEKRRKSPISKASLGSRSQSPTKYIYQRPASPKKVREKQSRGIFHALRNLISDWSRQGQKLTHKKSKVALVSDTANTLAGGKDVKNQLELKKSKSGESTSKDEPRRNRKGIPPSISIIPPQVHSRNEARSPTAETESPAPGTEGYESEGYDSRLPRHKRSSYHRRRSTSSSITSLHSRHRYSHSKTSSTSSMESGSVSTPRHNKGNLKIVPATPPPHLLTHEGAKGFGSLWGDGVVIARRRRSPFRGPPVGFMSSSLGKNRKGQPKPNGKWPEGAIQEEDEDVYENAIDEGDLEGEGDLDELGGRASYDAMRRGSEADQRSISASV